MVHEQAVDGTYQAAYDKLADFMGKSRPGSLKYRAVAGELARLEAQNLAEITEIQLQHAGPIDQHMMSAVLEAGGTSVRASERRIGRNPLARHYASAFAHNVFPAYSKAVLQATRIHQDYQTASLQARGEAISTAQTHLRQIGESTPRRPVMIFGSRKAA